MLAWDPSPDSLAAGYHVYYGTASGDYTQTVTTGNATSVVISNLVGGVTYYFAVTAFDILGLESLLSNEVSYEPPLAATTNAPALTMTRAGGNSPVCAFVVAAGAKAGSSWVLQASRDLVSWNSISAGSNAVNATVVIAGTRSLFFRLDCDAHGVFLNTQTLKTNAFPNSFFITTTGGTPSMWNIESSEDLKAWSRVASGTNQPVNIAVLTGDEPRLFFRTVGN